MDENESPVRWSTKIAVVLRDDLKPWQELNVTSFLISGIAAANPESIGEPYEDGSGNTYASMFVQPVLAFSANSDKIETVLARLESRNVAPAIYTEELFSTGNDIDNRAAVKAVEREKLNLVGIAFRCDRSVADKVLKGLQLHEYPAHGLYATKGCICLINVQL